MTTTNEIKHEIKSGKMYGGVEVEYDYEVAEGYSRIVSEIIPALQKLPISLTLKHSADVSVCLSVP